MQLSFLAMEMKCAMQCNQAWQRRKSDMLADCVHSFTSHLTQTQVPLPAFALQDTVMQNWIKAALYHLTCFVF